jgi:hypothetical protein
MNARRGGALILTIIVMLFFVTRCGAVIGVAQMNVAYYSFFEHRGLLKQATLTFAESLAEKVQENAATWWLLDKTRRRDAKECGDKAIRLQIRARRVPVPEDEEPRCRRLSGEMRAN